MKVRDFGKVPGVTRHDPFPMRKGDRCDQQVHVTRWAAAVEQVCFDPSKVTSCRHVELEHYEGRKRVLHSPQFAFAIAGSLNTHPELSLIESCREQRFAMLQSFEKDWL